MQSCRGSAAAAADVGWRAEQAHSTSVLSRRLSVGLGGFVVVHADTLGLHVTVTAWCASKVSTRTSRSWQSKSRPKTKQAGNRGRSRKKANEMVQRNTIRQSGGREHPATTIAAQLQRYNCHPCRRSVFKRQVQPRTHT